MKLKASLLAVLLALLPLAPAQAVTKPSILLTSLAPTVATNFSGGDEVSQILTSPSAVFLLGTIETTSSPLVTSTTLGGSDGFITALNFGGGRLWDLRVGSSGDDVATAGCIDSAGNIWIAGSSAIATTVVGGATELNRLTIWEVSPTGLLLNTFTKDLAEVDVPTSITLKGANFIIQGISNKVGFPTFLASLTPLGKIGVLKPLSGVPATTPQIFTAKSSAYLWQGFVAKRAIKGVKGISLHPRTDLLLKLSLKDKSLKGAYSLTGAAVAMQYQSGLGVVVLSQGASSYFLTILHTK